MPKPFDLLQEFGKFGADRKISLRDPAAKAAFGAHVSDAVDQALADPILLHGQRAEAMFEALLVSLGEFRLFKPEDGGRIFSEEKLRAPDFRVVLADGTQWLIEVKNVYVEDPFEQRRLVMSAAYRQSLEGYAQATGGELKLAVFWARWAVWTLVTPALFADPNGEVVLDMMEAMRANELGRLGDRTIGTRPPLRFRLTTDPERTSPVGADGMVEVVAQSAQIFCGDDEIVDPVEQQIAWIFMQHGEWESSGPEAIIDGDRLLAIEFLWEPREQTNEGFEFIGSLSRMFSRYYAEHTIEDAEVVQLRAPLRPGWFTPLIRKDHTKGTLSLWLFELRPAYGGPAREAIR